MKKIIVFLVVCILATFLFLPKPSGEVSFSSQKNIQPKINKDLVNETGNRIEPFSQKRVEKGILYIKNEKNPYTGKLISHYENGQTRMMGDIKDGRPHGEFIMYYENGQVEVKKVILKGSPMEKK